ncbi:NADH dehydrogenase [ubiquinone] 1 alpha subcomplex subunit 5-like protein [Leptotrombidium deliense]|uniref:NADH dehydrogenase [ubiquinone] 1 alpha subcomplex subunit 5-like protein n=1 Tax=Leptotrombidium deliense TaxID=299467 RepID=A0A443SJW5_9ACAR|nr:NADH dehydrogenase [ubiquinone] 1 alpha subcomplex subunit 5-like protein [Leptotrombidium deliense]
MCAATTKVTTGLTRLAVAKNPHFTLKNLYTKIQKVLASMPQQAAYRVYTERIVNERLNIVNTEPEVTKLEQKINCGQVEELIKQAEGELLLAKKMLEFKPWEPLIEKAPERQWKWPA